MEPIHTAIDAHGHVRLVHLVDEGGDAGGHQVGGPLRDALADVADVGAVAVGGVGQAELLEDQPAVGEGAGLVGLDLAHVLGEEEAARV